MNQKRGHGWIVGDFLGWLMMGIIIFVVIHLQYPRDLIYDMLFWVGYSFVFIVIVVWEIKRPSKKEWHRWVKTFVVSLVLSFVLWFFVFGYVHDQLYGLSNPHFKIAEVNDSWSGDTLLVYAKVWNAGVEGSGVVRCEVKRFDLTIATKSQRVYLLHNAEKTISFSFSYYSDLKAGQPIEYTVFIES